MELAAIALCAFAASALTLFSGFGLGTILMPVVAVFLPVPVAVAVTALVHLLNNLFKLALLGRHVNGGIVLRFGLPALIASIPGAWALDRLSGYGALASYTLAGIHAEVTPVKLAAGFLLLFFATADVLPFIRCRAPTARSMLAGGLFSGFFGGLSGHQGAFRSGFLVDAGLDKNAFIATSAAIASLVDISRLVMYGIGFGSMLGQAGFTLPVVATLASFAGALLGTLWLKKMTIISVQRIVAAGLYLLGAALAAGVI